MKREFSSTPEEAFKVSNEGLYYGKQIAEARKEGRIRRVYYDANIPVLLHGILAITILRRFGGIRYVGKRFTFWNTTSSMVSL
jgi:hypothetical protein